jgi:hypothetical protein
MVTGNNVNDARSGSVYICRDVNWKYPTVDGRFNGRPARNKMARSAPFRVALRDRRKDVASTIPI